MKTMIFGFCILIAATTAVQADWLEKTEGPDVFGKTKVFVTTSSGPVRNEDLVVQCDDGEYFDLAFVINADPVSEVLVGSAELLVQIDGGSPLKLSASYRRWNDRYFAAVISDRTPQLMMLLDAIGGAKRAINVGVDIAGVRHSGSFGVVGSRRAMNTLIRGCKLLRY
jgi:hypothetical protein